MSSVGATVIVIQPGAVPDVVTLEGIPLSHAWISTVLTVVGPGAHVSAFRMELDARTWLTGWCHDEGILLRAPLNFVRWTERGDPIHGPVVVTREDRDDDGRLRGVDIPADLNLLRFVRTASGRVLAPTGFEQSPPRGTPW